MSQTHHVTYQVRYYECDRHGYVHYANYLRYMQETAFAASEAIGYGEARYTALGYQWLAYATDIEYQSPLHYGETFTNFIERERASPTPPPIGCLST